MLPIKHRGPLREAEWGAAAPRNRDDLTSRWATAAPVVQALRGLARDLDAAEVLALVAAGRSNREIARALFISPKPASVHVSNILAKLGVHTRVEAAAVAHRLGLD
jgi:DNA-binding CsgD family transcriptional regulator